MTRAAHELFLDRIHVWRGETHVLKGVSLMLDAGELLHVAGANGSGKTTLLRVASGLLKPEQGAVSWRGAPLARVREAFQSNLAYAAHEPALKADLTTLENLRFAVCLKRRTGDAELRDSLDRAGVGACADLPARVLSAGQRRRAAMARVLAVRAPLWLLDEPFTNLDDAGTKLVSGLLREHAAAGGAALVVAHHVLDVGAAGRRLVLAE